MYNLGLDLSTRKSGWSLFKDQRVIDYGVWSLVDDKNKEWRERIVWMSQKFYEFCDNHHIDKVYCEDVPPTRENSQTVKVLSALQGCIITICVIKDIEIEFIPVTQWKNIIGIDLSHSKEYKSFVKLHKGEDLDLFKKYVKQYEKALSIKNANIYIRHLEKQLKWVSMESKFNQDDIADSINVVLSQVKGVKANYGFDSFDDIMERLYIMSRNNIEKRRRGFHNYK